MRLKISLEFSICAKIKFSSLPEVLSTSVDNSRAADNTPIVKCRTLISSLNSVFDYKSWLIQIYNMFFHTPAICSCAIIEDDM